MKNLTPIILILLFLGILGLNGFLLKQNNFLSSATSRNQSATDLTCTDCLNATEIEDIYLFNNADDSTTGLLSAAGGLIGQASSTVSAAFNVDGLSSLIGGFISSASSTVSSDFTVAGALNASSTANFFGGLIINSTGELLIPSAANPAIGTANEIAIETTSGQSAIKYHDGTAERALYDTKSFSVVFATSTMQSYQGVASSTFTWGLAVRAMTVVRAACYTPSGTFNVEIGDGSASSTSIQGTANNLATFTTLGGTNTYAAGELRYISFEPSTLVESSCTFEYRELD